ncbi:MAG: hypothetical protein QM642_09550 [Edaphocola sp.]
MFRYQSAIKGIWARGWFLSLLHAFAVAACLLALWRPAQSFDLHKQKWLVVSQATAHGVDIAGRTIIVYKLLLLGLLAMLALYWFFRKAERGGWLRWAGRPELSLFSTATVCYAFMQVMGCATAEALALVQLLFWIRFVTVLVPLRRPMAALSRLPVFSLSVAFGGLLCFGILFLIGYHDWVRRGIVGVFMVCVLACMLLYRFGKTIAYATWLLYPLVLVPFWAFVSLEWFLQQKLNGSGGHFSHKVIFLLLLLFTSLAMAVSGKVCRKRTKVFSLVKYGLAPSIVAAFVLLVFYRPLLPAQHELFESSSPANTVMNVFYFHQRPILDFFSAHLFSEQWYGYLYGFINGFNGTEDFMVYGFFNLLFFCWALAALFNVLWRKPLLSAFMVVGFPLLYYVYIPDILLSIVPFLMLKRLWTHSSVPNFLLFFFLLAACMAWRLDTGVASAFAAIFVLPLFWYGTRRTFPLSSFLKAIAIFLSVVALVALLLVACSSAATVQAAIQLNLHLFANSQAHGYPVLTHNPNQQFYIYYVLMPAVALLVCVMIVLVSRKYTCLALADKTLMWVAFVLLLIYFGNLQRAMVRHGFLENSDNIVGTLFYPAVALLASLLLVPANAWLRAAAFFFLSFFGFVCLKYFPLDVPYTPLQTALANNAFKPDYTQIDKAKYVGRSERDSSFYEENFGQIKRLLDQNLKPDQTFLDFSNTPSLYFHCRRKVLGYFSQNMQNSVDDYLQLDMLRRTDTQHVPVVVYANYPRTYFDATDEIENELRYYLVAEYIFGHYRPYGVVGNKSLWATENLLQKLPRPKVHDTLLGASDTISMWRLPVFIGQYYGQGNKKDALGKIVSLWWNKNGTTDTGNIEITIGQKWLKECHAYLELAYKSTAQSLNGSQRMDIVGLKNNAVVSFAFDRDDQVSKKLLFRMSNHYFWHFNNGALKIIVPHGNDIESVSLWRDKRFAP